MPLPVSQTQALPDEARAPRGTGLFGRPLAEVCRLRPPASTASFAGSRRHGRRMSGMQTMNVKEIMTWANAISFGDIGFETWPSVSTSPSAPAATGPSASLGPLPHPRRLPPSSAVLGRPREPLRSDNSCSSRRPRPA